MEFTPPTNTSKTYLDMEWISQNIYWNMAEDLRLQKGQEHLHVTKKDKKNQKGIRMGPAPQGERAMKEERFPHSECPLTGRQGDQQGQSVSCGALEESEVEQFTEGRMKRALQTGDATFPTLPASDTCPTIWAETVWCSSFGDQT